MKKITLFGVKEILTEKEMKNVMGGSGNGLKCHLKCNQDVPSTHRWVASCPSSREQARNVCGNDFAENNCSCAC